MRIELTEDMIRSEIQAFQDRIQAAWETFEKLPVTASTWQGRKKLKAQRRWLEGEVEHVQTLIRYAQEALRECA